MYMKKQMDKYSNQTKWSKKRQLYLKKKDKNNSFTLQKPEALKNWRSTGTQKME